MKTSLVILLILSMSILLTKQKQIEFGSNLLKTGVAISIWGTPFADEDL